MINIKWSRRVITIIVQNRYDIPWVWLFPQMVNSGYTNLWLVWFWGNGKSLLIIIQHQNRVRLNSYHLEGSPLATGWCTNREGVEAAASHRDFSIWFTMDFHVFPWLYDFHDDLDDLPHNLHHSNHGKETHLRWSDDPPATGATPLWRSPPNRWWLL